MKSKVAFKIVKYFETLKIGDEVTLNDIGLAIGRKWGEGPSNCMKSHIMPNATGIIKIEKWNRKTYYKVVGNPSTLMKAVENGTVVKRERTNKLRKAKKNPNIMVEYNVGVDFDDNYIVVEKAGKFGIYDKTNKDYIIDANYDIMDLLSNYDKYAKLALISNL